MYTLRTTTFTCLLLSATASDSSKLCFKSSRPGVARKNTRAHTQSRNAEAESGSYFCRRRRRRRRGARAGKYIRVSCTWPTKSNTTNGSTPPHTHTCCSPPRETGACARFMHARAHAGRLITHNWFEITLRHSRAHTHTPISSVRCQTS